VAPTEWPEEKPPAVALVGPTASGKSAMALALARRRPGAELVSVDSMAVYRGMDVGTAKPSEAERGGIRYHLVDLVDPEEEFSVRSYQRSARRALSDIARRGKRALLVGGTGLYLRAVVDDLDLPGRWSELACMLEAEADAPGGLATLYRRLRSLDPVAAARIEPGNRRRIIRALEVTVGAGRPFSSFGPGLEVYPATSTVLLGIRFVAGVHDPAIEARFHRLMDNGLLEEVRALAARPAGLSRTARQALGYRELLAHLEGGVPLDEAVAEAVARTKAFARRQWAWFRRDPRIRWIDPGPESGAALLAAWDGRALPEAAPVPTPGPGARAGVGESGR
jgi:tRNA dimethylallyltransferase